ncbi:hypothetical protein ACU8KH_00170 [Lachancea thermotolerans]
MIVDAGLGQYDKVKEQTHIVAFAYAKGRPLRRVYTLGVVTSCLSSHSSHTYTSLNTTGSSAKPRELAEAF